MDGSLVGAHWLAVLDAVDVAIVRFDDHTGPSREVLASGVRALSAAFSGDGAFLAYATKASSGSCTMGAVSVPQVAPAGAGWSVPCLSPRLTWVGDDIVLHQDEASQASHVLRVSDGSSSDLEALSDLDASSDQAVVVANSGGHPMLFQATAPPESADAIQTPWKAFVARDGSGIALFSGEDVPELGFSLATTRVHWSPPPSSAPPCPIPPQPCAEQPTYALGDVVWRDAESVIVSEFDASVQGGSLKMQLVETQPVDPGEVVVPNPDLPVLYRNWGVLSDGSVFLLANPEDPSTDPWHVSFQATSPNNLYVTGALGFAQYAVASGDESVLFVLSFSKPTSTVYALGFPLGSAPPQTLFTSSKKIGVLSPQPGGSGVVIGTGGEIPGEPCPLDLSSDCASIVYYISDGRSVAVALPTGLSSVAWAPDGAGVIGILGDSVVYIAKDTPSEPKKLATGASFVLPTHW